MRDKDVFEYAIVRVVPRVEREEFLNAGIVLYCAAQNFLCAAFEIDERRLRAMKGDVNIQEVEQHLQAFERVCAGGPEAGAIGELPAGERFRWLTAPRSNVVQTSPTHTGLTTDAQETLNHLFSTLVR